MTVTLSILRLPDCSEPFGIFTQTLEFTSREEAGKLAGEPGRGSARDEMRKDGLFVYTCSDKDRMDGLGVALSGEDGS